MRNYFQHCKTNDDARKLYKELAMQLHPDLNKDRDTTAEFQEMKNQFDDFRPSLKTIWEENADKSRNKAKEADQFWYDWQNSIFAAVIDQLIMLHGVTISIAGDWLWITDTTYQMKGKLNAIKDNLPEGFAMRWQRNKKAWTISPKQFRKRTRREWSKEEIDAAFDSKQIVMERQKMIA